ncbi:MAG: hypothetical protein ACYS8W_03680 [Planctomycetota bacterium]
MKTAVTLEYMLTGPVKMKIAGKLIGHKARNGLELLKTVVGQGHKNIVLDLSQCTSTDSLGEAIFDWIRSQNGGLSVDILHPILGGTTELRAENRINRLKRA